MRASASILLAASVVLVAAAGADAQGLRVTPMIGAYVQGNSFNQLRSNADMIDVSRSSALALGAAVEFGFLRGSLAYASGATVSQNGVQGDVGTGKLLAGAVDLVLRPLPRVIVIQPYVLGGIGFKNQDYSWNSSRFDAFPRSQRGTAYHLGVGADLMLGGFGITAEVTDYISKKVGGGLGQHDAFAMLGVKLGL